MKVDYNFSLEFEGHPPRLVGYEATIGMAEVLPEGYVGPPTMEYEVLSCKAVAYTLCWGERDWSTPFRGERAEKWAPQLDYAPGGADEERILRACGLV